MIERASDRWVSIVLSVLLHGTLVAALVYGFWTYRQSRPPTPTLAIEATVVDSRTLNGAARTPPEPAPKAPPPAPEPVEPTGPPEPTPAEPQPPSAAAQQAETSLTPREQGVLELIALGARDREIAERLVVTESTVKKHVQNILRKLHARNRAEAVARLRGTMPTA